ncbi:DUF642 domain-containing protein [Nostoc sp. 'Lobaria pulmonaria (5183) cyanobiont']|uniref:DUF642 domain-containing protein n=1 Tax=Nostoc sp. 'Lobaria pulmonaria (5183) cyanobiont' TaxID=1618022 RepID=UPI000CF35A81|nr:DUF642 domain-containing protein [Nostoc sp. 'Lobaria pulmonaria (5183) cyanobiont']AVH71486.1 protein of unknown function DUF642 [Nostoc sp. 'Lobaria pulmonaria (5183) cyanobiont']
MKFTKKLSIIFCSLTTALLNAAVITNTYKSAAQANGPELITNGGFENDSLVDPNNPNATNPNVTGWIKNGDPVDTSGTRIDNFPNTANQGLSFGGFSALSYISQNVPTVVNQYYKLTFYLASTEEAPDLDNQFQAFIREKPVCTKKNTSYQPYTQYTFYFQAKETSTEIRFASRVKYAFLYLDDVSFQSTEKLGQNSVCE